MIAPVLLFYLSKKKYENIGDKLNNFQTIKKKRKNYNVTNKIFLSYNAMRIKQL